MFFFGFIMFMGFCLFRSDMVKESRTHIACMCVAFATMLSLSFCEAQWFSHHACTTSYQFTLVSSLYWKYISATVSQIRISSSVSCSSVKEHEGQWRAIDRTRFVKISHSLSWTSSLIPLQFFSVFSFFCLSLFFSLAVGEYVHAFVSLTRRVQLIRSKFYFFF